MKLNITKVLANIANEEYSTRFLLNANTEWNISADTDYINMYRTEVEMLNQKNMMVQECLSWSANNHQVCNARLETIPTFEEWMTNQLNQTSKYFVEA